MGLKGGVKGPPSRSTRGPQGSAEDRPFLQFSRSLLLLVLFTAVLSQNLADEKKICKQRSQMDRRVQIVHQLRANGGLCQHQLDSRYRVLYVAIQHREERPVFFSGV